MTTRDFGSAVANIVGGSAEVFTSTCEQLFRSLNALISIDFDGVDECRPGALYSVFDVNTLQVDLPEALGPKQVVDVLVATSTSFCMVDGNILWPSTNFPSCTLTCSYQSQCQETPSRMFVPTLVLGWLNWCPSGCVGGSGTYPSSLIEGGGGGGF